jgi:outer membrane PBP1 activator LpoA protein
MLPAHRPSRAVALALLAASAAFSCATSPPATPPARPAVQQPVDPRAAPPPAPEATPPPVAVAPPSVPDRAPPVAEPPPPVPLPPLQPGPAVTLLLPLDAPDFQPAAEAVERGFMAAMAAEKRTLEVVTRRTDASDESVLAGYDAAIQAGTRLVVGPMTRSGVAALARTNRVAVPTLALNQPEGAAAAPSTLFVFGLAVEAEARQTARRAWADGQRIVSVVNAPTALSRRSRDAFVDEWLAIGGHVIEVIEVGSTADPAAVTEILDRDAPHFVFLADSGDRARKLRPYLGSQMPVYATSQVNTTSDPLKNLDLNGVQFADMPWLLRPDDPAMARYPRPPELQGDLARFYAVGIDAFRIAAALLDGQRDFEFAGVTGRIAVHGSGLVARRPLGATFRDGRIVALE